MLEVADIHSSLLFLFQDFFVFLVEDDFVFVVINHLRNLSNLYISDTEGVKYQLSLSRVLYHNPFTDVSSPWLRYAGAVVFEHVHLFYIFCCLCVHLYIVHMQEKLWS